MTDALAIADEQDILTALERRVLDAYQVHLTVDRVSAVCALPPSMVWGVLRDHRVRRVLDRERTARGERTGLNPDDILRELAQIAYANIGDFVGIGEDGEPVIDIKLASPEKMAALTALDVIKIGTPDGVTTTHTKIKIDGKTKMQALMLLGKHTGLFRDDDRERRQSVTLNQERPFANLSTEEIRARLLEHQTASGPKDDSANGSGTGAA